MAEEKQPNRLQNCPHNPTGWCLSCVQRLYDENQTLKAVLKAQDTPLCDDNKHLCEKK